MNYRIWKYILQITDKQPVLMPNGSEILSVSEQDGNLCIWAMGDVSKEKDERWIEIIGTGNPIYCDMGVDRKFVGTAVMGSGLVWHVFESL